MSDEKQNTNTFDGLAAEGHGVSSPSEQDKVSDLEQTLTSKTEECKELNEKYLRLAAEFENYKRLAQRDQRDYIRFGNEQLLRELLPVLDNLERAIKSAKEQGSNDALVQGIDLTLKQFAGVLSKFGVQAVQTAGQPFDPTEHQAVAHVESTTVPEQHIVDEFQKGYRLHDRILRAAMVSVSAGAPKGPEAADA